MTVNNSALQFYYSKNGINWQTIGDVLDFGKLSDDYTGGYTGAMAILFVQDQMYETQWADFDYFQLK